MRQSVAENKLLRLERIVSVMLQGEDKTALLTYTDVTALFKDLRIKQSKPDELEEELPVSELKAKEKEVEALEAKKKVEPLKKMMDDLK